MKVDLLGKGSPVVRHPEKGFRNTVNIIDDG
jgi:hypothetical protein